jgi:hypothetical protein
VKQATKKTYKLNLRKWQEEEIQVVLSAMIQKFTVNSCQALTLTKSFEIAWLK